MTTPASLFAMPAADITLDQRVNLPEPVPSGSQFASLTCRARHTGSRSGPTPRA
jgi:hypothetical protein